MHPLLPRFVSLSLLLTSLFCSSPMMAQFATGHKISLPQDRMLIPLPNRLFYVDSVYSPLPDTASIGVVYRAMAGKVVPTYLKEGLSQQVKLFLFSQFPGLDPTHRPVRVRIDTFSYTEDPTQGYAFEADLTFFAKDSTGQYAPIYTANIDVETNGLSRGGRMADELIRACTALNTYLNDPQTHPNYLSDYEQNMKRAAVEMKLDTSRYATDRTDEDNILTCNKRRVGVYLSENELITNRPALVGKLAIEDTRNYAVLFRPNARRARYRFFGFSDGAGLYINTGQYGGPRSRYVRVAEVGRYLLWQDDYVTMSELSTRAAASSAGAAGGLIGGLIGGLVGAAATTRNDCIAIDIKTGKLMHITPDVLVSILARNPALAAAYEAEGKPRKANKIYEYMVRNNQMVGTLTD